MLFYEIRSKSKILTYCNVLGYNNKIFLNLLKFRGKTGLIHFLNIPFVSNQPRTNLQITEFKVFAMMGNTFSNFYGTRDVNPIPYFSVTLYISVTGITLTIMSRKDVIHYTRMLSNILPHPSTSFNDGFTLSYF